MAAENMTLHVAGVDDATKLGALVGARAQCFALTEATAQAVVNPTNPGGIPHELRAGFACRIARLNGETALADHFMQWLLNRGADEASRIGDPSYSQSADPRLTAMIRHVDLVTLMPKDAKKLDIARLRDAGVGEGDIVRLAELIAFTNYQVRVIAGLRLVGKIL